MSSEQPLPKQSEAQDGVRWMGGKEARGVATCATAAAAGSTPAAAAAAASRGPKRRAAAAAGSSPATAAAASRGPKRRAAESRGCGRGLLAGNYGRRSAARGRRSVPPPPPRCPPGTAAAAASLGPNAVPPSPVAAAVDCGPETAAAARQHVVLFKSAFNDQLLHASPILLHCSVRRTVLVETRLQAHTRLALPVTCSTHACMPHQQIPRVRACHILMMPFGCLQDIS